LDHLYHMTSGKYLEVLSHGDIFLFTCSNDSGSTPVQFNHSDQPESPIHVLEKVSISEGNVDPSADSGAVQPKQDEMLLPEGHQSSTVQIAPNYGFGIMPPMQAAHLVPFAGHETQAWDVSQTTGFVVSFCSCSCSVSIIYQALFVLAIITVRLKFLLSV